MKFCVAVLLLSSFVNSVQLQMCQDTELDWKGNNVKALYDCDVLKEKITIHLDKLVAEPRCVKSTRIDFKDSENTATKAGPFANPEKEIHLGMLPNSGLQLYWKQNLLLKIQSKSDDLL